MNRPERRRKIFEHFGAGNQVEKLLEELHELIDAIHLANEAHPNDPELVLKHDCVEEEAADVMVLLEQLKENRPDFKVGMDAYMVQKELRTIERIDSGYYEGKST